MILDVIGYKSIDVVEFSDPCLIDTSFNHVDSDFSLDNLYLQFKLIFFLFI